MRSVRFCLALCFVCALAAAGCTADSSDPDEGSQAQSDPTIEPTPEPARPSVSAPADATTVLPGEDPAGLALAASQAVFDEAPVVLVAAEGDLGAIARAASAAVRLGTPLLLTAVGAPADASADGDGDSDEQASPATDPVAEEIARLGASTLMAFGDGASGWARGLDSGVEVLAAPRDPEALAETLGATLGDARPVAREDLAGAVAALDRDEPALLEIEATDTGAPPESASATAPGAASEGGTLPPLEAAAPLDSLTALAPATEAAAAAAATIRAAGARVLVLDDPDPRADSEVIAALAEQPPESVLALGEDFGDAERLQARVDVAATGVELPGGGQVLYPGRRMVALYGHPTTPALGVMGEQPLDEAIERAREVAAEYEPVSDVPVVPTFEIITTIASASPESDNSYSRPTPIDTLRPWIEAAREEGFYVVLDLQPGRTDFLTQAQHYEELLIEPHVGLALDPEWRLKPDEVHLRQIGSVEAEEINEVVDWLADLTREHQLPQKLLVLHQFRLSMIVGRENVDASRDELAVLIHADGHGPPGMKIETWQALTASPPAGVWWGWKNFYRQDDPTWTAEETLELEPAPLFISYQ